MVFLGCFRRLLIRVPLADARGYALSPLSRLLVWVIRVFP